MRAFFYFERLKIFFDTLKAGFTPAVIISENQGHFLAYFFIISCCISCCIVLYLIGFLSRLSVFYHFIFDKEKPREASNHAGFVVFSPTRGFRLFFSDRRGSNPSTIQYLCGFAPSPCCFCVA